MFFLQTMNFSETGATGDPVEALQEPEAGTCTARGTERCPFSEHRSLRPKD